MSEQTLAETTTVESGVLKGETFEIAPFDEWRYADCVAAVTKELPSDYGLRYDYAVKRDHYRGGEEWVGPGNGADSEVQKQFVADDFIGEAIENISNAFVEPQLGALPLEAFSKDKPIPDIVQARIQEAESLLTWWWDKRKIQEVTHSRLRTSAWAGFAVIRNWVPNRYLVRYGDNTVRIRPTVDAQEAISYISVSAPDPSRAAIVTHTNTQEQCAIFLGEETIEGATVHTAEMVYLDPKRTRDKGAMTIRRIVYQDESRAGYRAELLLGGRLLMSEMRTRPILSDPVFRTQRQLNFISTMVTRMTETSGFRGRYIINAKPLGKRIKWEEGDSLPEGSFLERDEEQRLWAVIPQPRTLGSKTTTELAGLPQYDKETGNQIGSTTPSVQLEDPVDPGPYILAAEAIRRRGLRMVAQGHLSTTGTAELSGIAYEQFRATFEKDLVRRKYAEEGMLREECTQVLALVEHITGRPGYFTDYIRITIDQHVNAGPRSPQAVQLEMEAYEKNLLSPETAMSRINVEDIVGEMTRLRSSPSGILGMLEKASAIVDKFGPDAVIRVLKTLNVPQAVIDALNALPEDRPIPGVQTVKEEVSV